MNNPKPMQATVDTRNANPTVGHCYLMLYKNYGLVGSPYLRVDGPSTWESEPIVISHLNEVTLSDGSTANDSVSAVMTGPNCWAELYSDYSFSGSKILRLRPNTVIRDLGGYDMNDVISSVRVYCYHPESWSKGAATDPAYQSYGRNNVSDGSVLEAVEAQNVNAQIQTFVNDLFSFVPEVGNVFKMMSDLFWPNIGPGPDGVWAAIRDSAIELVQDLYEQQETETLLNAMAAIEGNIKHLRNLLESGGSQGNVTEAFDALLEQLNDNHYVFLPEPNSDVAFTLQRLQFFTAFGTIYLTTLWARTQYAETLYPAERRQEADFETWRKELNELVSTQVTAAREVLPGIVSERREKVYVDGNHHSASSDDYTAKDGASSWTSPTYYETIGYFPTYTEWYLENPEARAQDVQRRWQERLEAVLSIAVDDLLAVTNLWAGFHTDNAGKDPTIEQRRVQTGPFGRPGYRGNDPDQGNYADDYAEDETAKGAYYTSLTIHSDNNQIRGISLTDSGRRSAQVGNTGAPQCARISVTDQDAISSAFGGEEFNGDNQDTALRQLVFRNAGDTMMEGCGTYTGNVWQSSGPSGAPCRLVGVKGVIVDNRIDGIWLTWEYNRNVYHLPED